MKVVGFAGFSGSGKTTLVEQLIPELRLRGLSLPDTEAPDIYARLRAQGYSARYEGDRLLVVPETAR